MIEAHGIGGQADLPIPLELAVSGAVAALVLSFAVLVVAWRTPRYAEPQGRPAPPWLQRLAASPYSRGALKAVGLVAFLITVVTGVAGKNALTNPFFGIVYVWWWVGVVVASLLFGPVWRAISPMRTISAGLARISGGDPRYGIIDYPERLGHWPAALGLFAFVWLELVYRYPTDLGAVRLWCAVYVAVMLVGGAVFGHRFFARADPFEVYSTLAAKLSPWAVQEGRLVVRSPLANLATVTVRPGLLAVVGVLFGSTAFDSFRESSFWLTTTYESSLTKSTLDNLGLLFFCAIATGLFAGACVLVGIEVVWQGGRPRLVVDDLGMRRGALPRQFAHSVVPIVAGYILAHYLTLLVDTGTQTLARLSDPFGEGWDLIGTAGLEPSYWFSYHPTVLATIKVLGVVLGHVAAAVAAHDRAITLLPARHQVSGQLPLLAVMVVFTGGGLYLLFSA